MIKKRLLFCFIVACLFFSACRDGRVPVIKENDLQKEGLKGTVHIWQQTDLKRNIKTRFVYNKKGNILYKIIRHPDEPGTMPDFYTEKCVYTYDEPGNLTEIHILFSGKDGNTIEERKMEYTYTKYNQLSLMLETTKTPGDPEWTKVKKESYTYNNKGLKTAFTTYYWEGSKWVKSDDEKYDYDEQNRPVITYHYDKKGELAFQDEFSYNEAGKIVSQKFGLNKLTHTYTYEQNKTFKTIVKDNGEEFEKNVTLYNERNNIIEIVSLLGNRPKTVYVYDGHDNRIEEKYFNNDKLLEHRFDTYDTRGNALFTINYYQSYGKWVHDFSYSTDITYWDADYRWINAEEGLRIRDKPGLKSNKIMTLSYGTCLEVLEEVGDIITIGDVEGIWLKVRVNLLDNRKRNRNALVGYLFSGFVQDDPIM